MLVSSVNTAAFGHARASDAVTSPRVLPFANASAPTGTSEQLSRLVGELERLLTVLSARLKPEVDSTPLPAPVPDKRNGKRDEFLKGTPANTGIKPGDIFKDFYQLAEGNCVTISAIKAAMMRFGHNPYGIYKTIEATDSGYRIVMRDGFKLHITDDELKQAKAGAHFGTDRPNDVLVNAQFLYALNS